MATGYVYFVRFEMNGAVKIGWSLSPIERLETLLTASPGPITPLGVIPGGVELERELHARFGGSRAHREWFLPTPELLGFIQANAQAWPAPRARLARRRCALSPRCEIVERPGYVRVSQDKYREALPCHYAFSGAWLPEEREGETAVCAECGTDLTNDHTFFYMQTHPGWAVNLCAVCSGLDGEWVRRDVQVKAAHEERRWRLNPAHLHLVASDLREWAKTLI